MNSLKLLVGLLVAAAVVVFGAQNTQAVTFHLLIFKIPAVPLVLVVFAAIALGVILGWIVSAPDRFRRMRQRRGLETQVAAQERAVATTASAERSQIS